MLRPKRSHDQWFDTNDPAEELWGQLLRVHYLMFQRAGQFFQQYSITSAQYFVMRKVIEGDITTQQVLAEKLHVTKGNVSQMLKIMEREGLIERTAQGASKKILLTDKAKALLEELGPAHIEFNRSNLSSLSQDEQAQLMGLLEKLARGME